MQNEHIYYVLTKHVHNGACTDKTAIPDSNIPCTLDYTRGGTRAPEGGAVGTNWLGQFTESRSVST